MAQMPSKRNGADENLSIFNYSVRFALTIPQGFAISEKLLCCDARMVESVDTRDLKSLGYYSCVGSSPTSGT